MSFIQVSIYYHADINMRKYVGVVTSDTIKSHTAIEKHDSPHRLSSI